jgi:hypothetical protein
VRQIRRSKFLPFEGRLNVESPTRGVLGPGSLSELLRAAGSHRALGEPEHVGAQGVLSASASLGGRSTPSGSTSRSKRRRKASRAGRVRALRSVARLHEM